MTDDEQDPNIGVTATVLTVLAFVLMLIGVAIHLY